MAIPSIAETQFPLFSPVAVAQMRAVLVRETERSLFLPSPLLPLADTVDISETSRLLSSMADLAEAANTAQSGDPVDRQSVVDDAQRFVDSVNALNLAQQFELGGLFGLDAEAVVTGGAPVAEPASFGVDLVPLGDEEGTFLLSLDGETLMNSLEADPAGTTRQFATFALPLGTEVATQSLQEGLLPNFSAAGADGAVFTSVTDSVLTTEVLGAMSAQSEVVPDLIEMNSELRRALADTVLTDTLAKVLVGTPNAVLPQLSIPAPLDAERANLPAPRPATATEQQGRSEVEAPVPPAPFQEAVNPATQNTPVATPVTTNALEPPQALLTPVALISTPLEQIARMATNPTLGAAVAAFQITGDEGGRNAKVALQSDFDVVNPLEAVLQTEAIGPNLANTSEQRREGSTDSRLNAWLATRPGLI